MQPYQLDLSTNQFTRKSFFSTWIAVGIFCIYIFSFTRGLVVIALNDASLTQLVYSTSFFLILILSVNGLIQIFGKNSLPKSYKRILILNGVFSLIWLIITLFFRQDYIAISTIFYIGLIPFSILMLIKLPVNWVKTGLVFATITLSSSIILEFIQINTDLIDNGLTKAIARQTLLRPDQFQFYQRTGSLLRPNGFIGYGPHDAANILAMLAGYWVIRLIKVRAARFHSLLFSVISLVALMITQVASNILACILGCLLVLLVSTTFKEKLVLILSGLTLLFLAGITELVEFPYYLTHWFNRVHPDKGDWVGMLHLNLSGAQIENEILAILIGHGPSLQFSAIGRATEFSFLRIILEHGIFHSVTFFTILVAPGIYIFFNKYRKHYPDSLPFLTALLIGFISLWHYGSLLRSTNILIYLSLLAVLLKFSRRIEGTGNKHVDEANRTPVC